MNGVAFEEAERTLRPADWCGLASKLHLPNLKPRINCNRMSNFCVRFSRGQQWSQVPLCLFLHKRARQVHGILFHRATANEQMQKRMINKIPDARAPFAWNCHKRGGTKNVSRFSRLSLPSKTASKLMNLIVLRPAVFISTSTVGELFNEAIIPFYG